MLTQLPKDLIAQIVVKGILTAEEASEAARQGVDGILVSNHGARQLDTTPVTIDALPVVGDFERSPIFIREAPPACPFDWLLSTFLLLVVAPLMYCARCKP